MQRREESGGGEEQLERGVWYFVGVKRWRMAERTLAIVGSFDREGSMHERRILRHDAEKKHWRKPAEPRNRETSQAVSVSGRTLSRTGLAAEKERA